MHGTNPIRPLLKGDGSTLEVQEIFATIQGEGPNTGMPAIFIRLGGCNLACTFCDTEFESFELQSLEMITHQVHKLALNENKKRIRELVVITGGEPFRQPIEALCDILIDHGYKVQIETNGTLYRPVNNKVEIVCSPKNLGKGYNAIRDDLVNHIDALKFLISASNQDYQHITDIGQSTHNIPVYLQPMDEYDNQKNAENLVLAKELAETHGYRLSLQVHKIIGMP